MGYYNFYKKEQATIEMFGSTPFDRLRYPLPPSWSCTLGKLFFCRIRSTSNQRCAYAAFDHITTSLVVYPLSSVDFYLYIDIHSAVVASADIVTKDSGNDKSH